MDDDSQVWVGAAFYLKNMYLSVSSEKHSDVKLHHDIYKWHLREAD